MNVGHPRGQNPKPDLATSLASAQAVIAELEARLETKVASSEAAVRELQHFHYALDQHASVAVTDLQGIITYANHRFCDLSGYTQTELIGRTHAIVKSGVHPPALFTKMWEVICGGNVWHGELCNRKKTGEHYWIDACIVPYKDEGGAITQFVSIRIDITDRKETRDRLVAQEAKTREINGRLRQISDNIPAMVSYWDRNEICLFANRGYFDRFGLTPQQIVGMSFKELFGAAYDDDRKERINAVLRGDRQSFEQSASTPEGRRRYWQSDYLPDSQGGEIVGFYALVVDVTERKMTEDRLRRQETLLAATSRMGEIGGWELSEAYEILHFSEMLSSIHELPIGEIPTFDVALTFYPLEERHILAGQIASAFSEGKPFDCVMPFITAKGRHRWVRSIGEPQWEDGRVTKIIGALQDVTCHKDLESELAQAQKLESIGQLAAGIAHEINTPTQFIGNNVAFIKDSVGTLLNLIDDIGAVARRQDDARGLAVEAIIEKADLAYLRDELPRAIDQSTDGIQRIQKIVGAMKEFSHPAVDKTLVDLNRAIESTIVVASNEWKYVADLETRLDLELPQVEVMPGSFNQVILNMIVNAAHAVGTAVEGGVAKKGCITISTLLVNNWVEIRIQDTGCGIPDAVRDRIFDPFFTTKPVGKGTGQGLAIAHDVIVKKHQGSIGVESTVGVGTTFILRLPISQGLGHVGVAT